MDGRLWHHLNEEEIWPTRGVFSEWMKFQSGNSSLRGRGRTYFYINSHGWSKSLDWWVKQAFYLRPLPFTMTISETLHPGSFFTNISDNEVISAKEFYMQAKPRPMGLVLTSIKPCIGDKVEIPWLPGLQLLVLRNLFCSFVSLYKATSS